MPGTAASAEASLSPALAACQSAENLRLIVEFMRETDTSEDGWVPLLVGAIAGLSEARTLAGLVGTTYQPLIDDLVTSLSDLRSTAEGLREQGTVGAQLEALGTAVAGVGSAMDALSVQLQTPCPTDG